MTSTCRRNRPRVPLSKPGALCGLLLAAVVATAAATAQTNDEILAGLQFNFTPPGARSLAVGHAFSGLADDATAAYANPAGLMWLTKPEISIEARSTRYSTFYPGSGSASGTPSFCAGPGWRGGDEGCLDTVAGPQLERFDSTTEQLSFLSYVHVFRPRHEAAGSRWRLALYRHHSADFEAEIRTTEGAFVGGPGTGRQVRSRLAGVDGALAMRIEDLGLAVAREVARGRRGRLWAGASLVHSTLDFDAVTRRFRSIERNRLQGNPALPGPLDFSPENEVDRHQMSGDDTGWSAHAGLLWRAESGRWTAGLVYRGGPELDFDYSFEWRARALAEAAEAEDPNLADPGIERALSGRSQLDVPDVFAVGFTLRPVEALLLTLEVDHVGYSALTPEHNLLVNVLRVGENTRCGDWTAGGQRLDPPVDCRVDDEVMARFRVDDGTEVHLGVEWTFGGAVKWSLRGGAWLDPDHQLRFDGGEPIDDRQPPSDRLAARFQRGEDVWHWTAGVGIVPSREHFQIDLAADLSDRADTFSLSAVYRW